MFSEENQQIEKHLLPENLNKRVFFYYIEDEEQYAYEMNTKNFIFIKKFKELAINDENKLKYGFETEWIDREKDEIKVFNDYPYFECMYTNRLASFQKKLQAGQEKRSRIVKMESIEFLVIGNLYELMKERVRVFCTFDTPFSATNRKLFTFAGDQIQRYQDPGELEEEKEAWSVLDPNKKMYGIQCQQIEQESLSETNMSFVPLLLSDDELKKIEEINSTKISFNNNALISHAGVKVYGDIEHKNNVIDYDLSPEVKTSNKLYPLKLSFTHAKGNDVIFSVEWWDYNYCLPLFFVEPFKDYRDLDDVIIKAQNNGDSVAYDLIDIKEDDLKMIKDMLLISYHYNNGWKDAPRYLLTDVDPDVGIYRSDVGKIKPDYVLGWGDWKIYSFVNSKLADINKKIYNYYKIKTANFGSDGYNSNTRFARKMIVNSLIAALGQYIDHPTLTIGSLSNFNEAFLPFTFVTDISKWKFENSSTKNRLDNVEVKTRSMYFNEKFGNQISAGSNDLNTSFNSNWNSLSEEIEIDLEKRFSLPILDNHISKIEKIILLKMVKIYNNSDLDNVFYIPAKTEQQFLNIFSQKGTIDFENRSIEITFDAFFINPPYVINTNVLQSFRNGITTQLDLKIKKVLGSNAGDHWSITKPSFDAFEFKRVSINDTDLYKKEMPSSLKNTAAITFTIPAKFEDKGAAGGSRMRNYEFSQPSYEGLKAKVLSRAGTDQRLKDFIEKYPDFKNKMYTYILPNSKKFPNFIYQEAVLGSNVNNRANDYSVSFILSIDQVTPKSGSEVIVKIDRKITYRQLVPRKISYSLYDWKNYITDKISGNIDFPIKFFSNNEEVKLKNIKQLTIQGINIEDIYLDFLPKDYQKIKFENYDKTNTMFKIKFIR